MLLKVKLIAALICKSKGRFWDSPKEGKNLEFPYNLCHSNPTLRDPLKVPDV